MRCKLTNRLAESLAAKGMKKSQLAFRLRMSRAYVTRLVKGEIHPRLETAIRIARYFRKPVEEIFELQEVNATPHVNFPGVPPSALGESSTRTEKSKTK